MPAFTRVGTMLLPSIVSGVGVAIAAIAGLRLRGFASNAIAALLGVLLAIAIDRLDPARLRRASLLLGTAACLLLAATLAASGEVGVRRWLPLGPAQLHVGAAVGPIIVYAISRSPRFAPLGMAAIAIGVHVVQPDGGQALALACATIAIAFGERDRPASSRWPLVVIGIAGVVAAWRPDGLPLVPEVEGILRVARARGIGTWLLGIAALASLVVVPITARAYAMAAYAAGAIAASFLGPYPVPVLGAGAGPVIGASLWLALASAARREQELKS